jgi:hypothetical protein
MIELAAAFWEVDHEAALSHMVEQGLDLPQECFDPNKIIKYKMVADTTSRLNALWEAAKRNWPAARSPTIQAIRRQHNLRLDIGPERWTAGPGQLMGAIHKFKAEKAFHPAAPDDAGNTSTQRVFKGPKWGEVIVVPWYDLPDRIRGFSFLGRQGHIGRDQVFKTGFDIHTSNTSRTEGGIAGYPSVKMAGEPGYVIAVNDWLLVLQIQLRNFRSLARPLPLVAWRDDGKYRTQNAWAMFSGQRIILWSKYITAPLIRQAMDNNAYICTLGVANPDRKSVQHYLRQRPGTDLERAIVKHARPWTDVLRSWAQRAGPGMVAKLINDLEARGADASYVLRQMGPASAFKDIPRPAKMIAVGRFRVTEQGDTWQVIKSTGVRSELSNARIEMTHAIKDKQNGQLYYFGKIYFKGHVVPFVAPVDVVRDKPYSFIQSKLTEHSLGVLATSMNNLLNIHHVAVSFREPEFVEDDLWRWVEKTKQEIT